MKILTTAVAAAFALALAAPAFAAPRVTIAAPSNVLLAQKSEEKKPVTSGGAGSNKALSKEAEKDKARANKGGETKGKDRAGDVQEMNKAKKAQ